MISVRIVRPLIAGGLLATALSAQSVSARQYQHTARPAKAVSGVARGSAYAEEARIHVGGTSTVSGPLALVVTGCQASNSRHEALLNGIHVTGAGQTAAADDVVVTKQSAKALRETSSSTIHDVKLLGGIVSATEIKAVASTKGTASKATATTAKSGFVGLSVNGVPQTVSSPNTKVAIPGVGYVILDESKTTSGKDRSSASVAMIHFVATVGNATLGLKKGDRIIVGVGKSKFLRTPSNVILGATAYGIHVLASGPKSTVHSGEIAPVYLSCVGGSTKNQAAGFSASGVGSVGEIKSNARGAITAPGSKASSENRIASGHIAGTVEAQQIHVHAWAKFIGTTPTGHATAHFGGISVAGQAVKVSAPNQRVDLPGLGYVIFNEQHHSNHLTGWRESVNAIDLFVTKKNSQGLPVGTRIIVGHASARVSRVS